MTDIDEQSILAQWSWELPAAKTVLVFAPHPDDEVFGCAGTLLKLKQQGADVRICIITDGSLGSVAPSPELVSVRANESRQAAALLGFAEPLFLNQSDRQLHIDDEMVGVCREVIEEIQPDLVFVTAPTEPNPDHYALAGVVGKALMQYDPPVTIAYYEVGYPLDRPNVLQDISAHQDKKFQVMLCFSSQLAVQPYHTQIRALNHYRSYLAPPEVTSVEAFVVSTSKQLSHGYPDIFHWPNLCRQLTAEVSHEKIINEKYSHLLEEKKHELINTHSELTHTQKDLTQTQSELAKAQSELAKAQSELAKAQSELTQKHSELTDTQYELVQAQQDIEELQHTLVEMNTELEEVRAYCQTIEGSSLWKLTAPLRKLLGRFPLVRKYGRIVLRGPWWLITGQFKARAQEVVRAAAVTNHGSSVSHPADSQGVDIQATTVENRNVRASEVDYSLAVPVSSGEPVDLDRTTVAVVCYLQHLAWQADLRRYLENIPIAFDLYLITDDIHKQQVCERVFAKTQAPASVRVVQKGTSCLPAQLEVVQDIQERYEFVLFLNAQTQDTPTPSDSLPQFFHLENLLGSADIVRSLLALLINNSKLGMVASQQYGPERRSMNWGAPFFAVQAVASRININLSDESLLDYPTHGMFWARTAALEPLLQWYRAEKATAHAPSVPENCPGLKQLLFYGCEAAGYDWIKVSQPRWSPQNSTVVSFDDTKGLSAFIDQYGCRLSAVKTSSVRLLAPTDPDLAPSQELITHVQQHLLGNSPETARQLTCYVGIVTYNPDPQGLKQCVKSSQVALHQAGLPETNILLIDNGDSTETIIDAEQATRIAGNGNVGFGAAHNKLMAKAFALGADVYLAVNPDGAFHPDAIDAMLRMVAAHDGRALVEALQFPAEHPKEYDPITCTTAWVSGACMAISRELFEDIGGFDDVFFMYCEDVDLSWRALANGYAVLTCPAALFAHAVTNRPFNQVTYQYMLESAVLLARKWGSRSFEKQAVQQLQALGCAAPSDRPQSVPEGWREVADFNHDFSFSRTRWV